MRVKNLLSNIYGQDTVQVILMHRDGPGWIIDDVHTGEASRIFSQMVRMRINPPVLLIRHDGGGIMIHAENPNHVKLDDSELLYADTDSVIGGDGIERQSDCER